MNLKFLCLVGALLVLAVACAPPAAQVEDSSTSTANADQDADAAVGDVTEEHAVGEESEEHADEEVRDLEAHEHGAAELTLAWSGSEVAIELRTPAHNVVGFEHAPESEEEQALLAESLQALEEEELFRILPEGAGCELTGAEVHSGVGEAEEHADEEAEHEGEGAGHEEEETHSEIDVEYTLLCADAAAIEALDMSELFARFPNFEEVRAQWVSDTQQSAKDLTRDDALLPLN